MVSYEIIPSLHLDHKPLRRLIHRIGGAYYVVRPRAALRTLEFVHRMYVCVCLYESGNLKDAHFEQG